MLAAKLEPLYIRASPTAGSFATDLRGQLQRTPGDNYTIEREFGGGGMSRVFVAEECSSWRQVVVTVLPPDPAATVNVERFRREMVQGVALNPIPRAVGGRERNV